MGISSVSFHLLSSHMQIVEEQDIMTEASSETAIEPDIKNIKIEDLKKTKPTNNQTHSLTLGIPEPCF